MHNNMPRGEDIRRIKPRGTASFCSVQINSLLLVPTPAPETWKKERKPPLSRKIVNSTSVPCALYSPNTTMLRMLFFVKLFRSIPPCLPYFFSSPSSASSFSCGASSWDGTTPGRLYASWWSPTPPSCCRSCSSCRSSSS